MHIGTQKRCLVVKIGAIGDVIMCAAALKRFRESNPHIYVTWLCGKTSAALLKTLAVADQIIEIDESKLFKGTFITKTTAILRIWKQLFWSSYDLVVIGHSDSRYQLFTKCVKTAEVRSFGLSNGRRKPIPGRYHGDEYLSLFTGVDGPDQGHASMPRLRPELPSHIDNIFKTLIGPFVAIIPGGAKNALADDQQRRWPLDYYVQLSKKLREKEINVVITGAASDAWVLEAFNDAGTINLIGQTNLLELVGVYTRCAVVVTHDSGPLHIAELSGVKIVALFGSTSPSEKVDPFCDAVILWGGESLACRPCYDGKTYAKCSKISCMQGLSVESVFNAVLSNTKQPC
jgi:heptosyltransferase-2